MMAAVVAPILGVAATRPVFLESLARTVHLAHVRIVEIIQKYNNSPRFRLPPNFFRENLCVWVGVVLVPVGVAVAVGSWFRFRSRLRRIRVPVPHPPVA